MDRELGDRVGSIIAEPFVIHGLLIFSISMGFILLMNRRADVARWTPVGPYFASISTLFALFLAFHGASIWSNKAQAQRAYIDAGTAIKRLDDMLSPAQLDLSGPRSSLQRYVRYVFRDEWRKTRNTHPSERAEFAFRELQQRIAAASAQMSPSITPRRSHGWRSSCSDRGQRCGWRR